MKTSSNPWRFPTILLAATLMLTGCTGGEQAETEDGESPLEDEPDQISIGTVPGWSDHSGIAHLYEHVLEDNGYDVEVQDTVDVAPAYEAVATGELDLYATAWPERTQNVYWEQYEDSLEDLGAIYGDAQLFLAVPEYWDITSIEELPDYADELDGEITGIESGAGLSVITEEEVMPHYGLDEDFELRLSSADGMLGELEAAMENKEEIVVTFWRPYWAGEQYDVRALEDPDNVYGDAESVHTIARTGFSQDHPEVAEMIENFSLTNEQIAALQNAVVNESEDDNAAAVEAWIDDNPEVVEDMASYLNG